MFEEINWLYTALEVHEHANKHALPRASYSLDVDEMMHYSHPNIYLHLLQSSGILVKYLGLQGFLKFSQKPPSVLALPHIQSLWFLVYNIQLSFDAHGPTFRPIRALFTLIMWPRSPPPTHPQNHPIASYFVPIDSNSLGQYIVSISSLPMQYWGSYSTNIPDPFNLEPELCYFR